MREPHGREIGNIIAARAGKIKAAAQNSQENLTLLPPRKGAGVAALCAAKGRVNRE